MPVPERTAVTRSQTPVLGLRQSVHPKTSCAVGPWLPPEIGEGAYYQSPIFNCKESSFQFQMTINH